MRRTITAMVTAISLWAPALAQADYGAQVHRLVKHVHRLQHRLFHHRTPYHGHVHFRTLLRWREHDRLWSARWTPWTPGWLSAALCVHEHEGSWQDPAPPYYGGMQMDASFASTYGPEFWSHMGTPDRWMAHQQLLAAHRGWLSRGWTPWPNTARACGLL